MQTKYYVHGPIEASDQESLCNYTKRIGELTLGAEPDSEPRLAPHLLTRIAQHQDPTKVLFPHLHHLRIVHTSSSLNFLHPLLSPALTTLELTAIRVEDPCYSSVLSFLESAIHQAPHLSTLIVGPGQIQDQILDMCSRYKNLRCFKLLDVGISITDQFLQDIGLLQHLETFVIRTNRTSTYKHSPASPVINAPDIVETMSFSQDPEPTNAGVNADKQIIGPALFSALRTFEVDGTFGLIADILDKITSSELQALSIDITKSLERVSTGMANPSSRFSRAPPLFGTAPPSFGREPPSFGTAPPSFGLEPPSFGTAPPSFGTSPPSFGREPQSFGTSPPSFGLESQSFGTAFPSFPTTPPSFGPELPSCGTSSPSQPPAHLQISTADIVTLFSRPIQKWHNTLVSVSLKNDSPTSFLLPHDIFEDLLLCQDMKHLEITGMDIDSMNRTLLRLSRVSSRLENLHLPVHFDAPGIPPARLRDIAESCSHLKTLRCRLRTWDMNPSDISVLSPLSHQLEVLSVCNERVQLTQHLSIGIARYLDSIFPRLNSIHTHNEGGSNTEQWAFIFDMVKSYQAVRMDESQRRTLG
jgi:hypothetical protein